MSKDEKKEQETVQEGSNIENEQTLNDKQEEASEEVAEVEKKESADDKVAALEAKIAELKDKNLRLYADFENLRRRTAKEKLELMQTAGRDLIVDLLPVLDDLERASESIAKAKDVDSVKEGFQLIQNKLTKQLTQKGLKAMECKGEPFDADKHEALTEIPAPSEDLKGKVVDEVEKGYYLNDRIIRFAKVVVGK